MSLKKQIFILIAAVLVSVYTGMLYISIKSTQEYLNNQLAVHAQDTATSLGLSLAEVIRQRDLAQATSMIDLIFDRGYFAQISLNAWQGEFIVERKLDIWSAKAPAWFINLLSLHTPVQTTQILIDWKNKANLSVSIHPGYAYDELWKVTRNNILWLSLMTILISLIVFYGLRRVLQPLAHTEQQALAIARKEYRLQKELPRTRELRNVVRAMNMMAEKVRENIETQVEQANHFQQLAYRDALTKIANRRAFLAEVENFVQHREKFRNGAVFIIHLTGLMNANQQYGYEYGDQALAIVKDCLCSQELGKEKLAVARIGGSDFGLLLKNPHANETVDCAKAILTAYMIQADSKYPGDLYVGITEFDSEKDIRTILSEADQARRQAESFASKKWHLFEGKTDIKSTVLTASEWRILLAEAVAHERFELYVQPVKYFADKNIESVEVLLRMEHAGESVPASVFLATAEEQGLLPDIDRLVVRRVLDFAGENAGRHYAVNLNAVSLENTDFVTWLLATLNKSETRAQRIVFEIGESAQLKSESIQNVLRQLAECSAGVAIERFGSGNHDFGYLMKLKLRYIKISGYYIRGIEDNSEHQFYLKTLLHMAHNLELDVLAESVETEAVAEMAEKLGFDGIQGYYIGHPQPM